MSERSTPETDAQSPWRYSITTPNGVTTHYVPADFARKLERERDEARAGERAAIVERERWKMRAEEKWAMRRELEEVLGVTEGAACDEQFAKGMEALRQLIRERDEAREKLQLVAQRARVQAGAYKLEDLRDNSRWSIFNEGRAQALEAFAEGLEAAK